MLKCFECGTELVEGRDNYQEYETILKCIKCRHLNVIAIDNLPLTGSIGAGIFK